MATSGINKIGEKLRKDRIVSQNELSAGNHESHPAVLMLQGFLQ